MLHILILSLLYLSVLTIVSGILIFNKRLKEKAGVIIGLLMCGLIQFILFVLLVE